MRNYFFRNLMVLAIVSIVFVSCQKEDPIVTDNANPVTDTQLKAGNGFVHGIVIEIDGEDYYFAGAPDGPNGATDVPGHYWRLAGKDKVMGKHFNTGPFGSAKFWSSEADDGAFLYTVKGIIDIWTPELAQEYYDRGYVHRHEFARVSDGEPHPSKVIWLKHIAVTHFLFDGPMAPNAMFEHEVTPGLDWNFPNNYMMPYPEPE